MPGVFQADTALNQNLPIPPAYALGNYITQQNAIAASNPAAAQAGMPKNVPSAYSSFENDPAAMKESQVRAMSSALADYRMGLDALHSTFPEIAASGAQLMSHVMGMVNAGKIVDPETMAVHPAPNFLRTTVQNHLANLGLRPDENGRIGADPGEYLGLALAARSNQGENADVDESGQVKVSALPGAQETAARGQGLSSAAQSFAQLPAQMQNAIIEGGIRSGLSGQEYGQASALSGQQHGQALSQQGNQAALRVNEYRANLQADASRNFVEFITKNGVQLEPKEVQIRKYLQDENVPQVFKQNLMEGLSYKLPDPVGAGKAGTNKASGGRVGFADGGADDDPMQLAMNSTYDQTINQKPPAEGHGNGPFLVPPPAQKYQTLYRASPNYDTFDSQTLDVARPGAVLPQGYAPAEALPPGVQAEIKNDTDTLAGYPEKLKTYQEGKDRLDRVLNITKNLQSGASEAATMPLRNWASSVLGYDDPKLNNQQILQAAASAEMKNIVDMMNIKRMAQPEIQFAQSAALGNVADPIGALRGNIAQMGVALDRAADRDQYIYSAVKGRQLHSDDAMGEYSKTHPNPFTNPVTSEMLQQVINSKRGAVPPGMTPQDVQYWSKYLSPGQVKYLQGKVQ